MKINLLKALMVLSVLVFTVAAVSCDELFPKQDDTNNPNDDSQDDDSQDPTQAPKQIISLVQAKEMFDTYTERRVGLIRDYENEMAGTDDYEPTRYGWYDYNTVKQYIAFIEEQAAAADVEISGLQFYLANYPDANEFSDGKPVAYPKQNTFFIVPTMNDGEENVAFYINNSNGTSRARPVKERVMRMGKNQGMIENNRGKMLFSPKMMMITAGLQGNGEEDQSLILNESTLRPPPPKPTDMDN